MALSRIAMTKNCAQQLLLAPNRLVGTLDRPVFTKKGCQFVENLNQYFPGRFWPVIWTPRGDLNYLMTPELCTSFGLFYPGLSFGWSEAESTQAGCEGWASICNDLSLGPDADAQGSPWMPKVDNSSLGQ